MNMSLPAPADEQVARFRSDMSALVDVARAGLGVAVSGGPDSLALLLLAAAAFPGQVEAATMDHGLRSESAGEAAMVAEVAGRTGAEHRILAPHWERPPARNLPAAARRARYAALCGWAAERRLAYILTAHHLDDQAETLLMRLGRGAGVAGLAGVRAVTRYRDGAATGTIVRPLLRWRKAQLVQIVAGCGLSAVQDPTNADERLDRTHVRRLLAATPQLDPVRLADAAAHLADADAALAWMADDLFAQRCSTGTDGSMTLAAHGLPHELQRRLLVKALARFTGVRAFPGPKVNRLLSLLSAGEAGMLGDVRVFPGPSWRFEHAPPRRH